jgi:hypothetical protein
MAASDRTHRWHEEIQLLTEEIRRLTTLLEATNWIENDCGRAFHWQEEIQLITEEMRRVTTLLEARKWIEEVQGVWAEISEQVRKNEQDSSEE